MNYLEYRFCNFASELVYETLIALLSEEGYEGFIEDENDLISYIEESKKDEIRLEKIIQRLSDSDNPIKFSSTLLEEKNWNDLWEREYNPITIESEVRIRASFHNPDPQYKYDLIIDPKMSFGTGHHETSRLMIRAMLECDLEGKYVLDIGTGTGVLAILADKMGAIFVTAVDIDKWAFENSVENSIINHAKNVQSILGSIENISGRNFDVILVNISRNVLLEDLQHYYSRLAAQGLLLVSGIMNADIHAVSTEAERCGYSIRKILQEGNWASIILAKSSNF